MSIEKVTIHTDGASRGNPGPAAVAFVVSVDDVVIAECSATIGSATNNVAEYTALIRGLEFAHGLGARAVQVLSDSELMVRQMRGEYRVKHPDLVPLFETAKEWAAKFASVQIDHVRREDNAEADRLCNEALDGRAKTPAPWKVDGAKPVVAADAVSNDPVITYLEGVQAAWRRGGTAPTPAEVWQHIQQLNSRGTSARRKKKRN
jgi:ribonuclease HI